MNTVPPVVVKPSLENLLAANWEHCRVILFSAPCGCGKTTTAAALLRGRHCVSADAAETDFASIRFPRNCEAVLIDNLQQLTDPTRQQALVELIRCRTELHFVLLGRCRVPGWLMPFQVSGLMLVLDTEALLLDRASARRMLEGAGLTVSPDDMTAIQQDFKGYPLSLTFLCAHLEPDAPYTRAVFDACRRDLFVYYDDAVFRRFDEPLRQLLVSLAPFGTFTVELARMVSGDPHAGERLGLLQRDTAMLLAEGLDSFRFWPIFRVFLQWEMQQHLIGSEQRILYSRAALYYELQGELREALRFYALAGEQSKISALLVKNAEQHPGVGHYRELQDYYFALPREEVLRSPTLMCGMSMLSAMCLDYESSEDWYCALRDYLSRLRKTDTEYRTAQSKLLYLDIALPQRGSKGLTELIANVFRVMADRQLAVPSFSVTSTLPSIMNGGKDFCDWSKKDELLYATMRRPVETVLGRDGVGLADCAICESKFEKGEDVSKRLLTLMSRLGEIQARGTPDIEFAVVGLLARVQVSQGKAYTALESLESLRAKFLAAGETRFLGNLDAMLCRIRLRVGGIDDAHVWLRDSAPQNDVRLWAMWRYQYLTRAMVQLTDGACEEALLLLARLEPYCERCGRVMDGLHLLLMTALCQERMGSPDWKDTLAQALDTCREYSFVWPVAQYGAAILPLLGGCGWEGDPAYLERLTAAARTQAVHYPRFLRRQAPAAAPLSAQELQVLKLMCENLSNQEIGEILNIKLPTVKTHVSHILQKLGVSRRSEAREAAERLRLIQ
jgi:LuxR family maltose regulon positive regulatory protein